MINTNLLHFEYGKRSNQVVILIHGFMGSYRDWDNVIENLSGLFNCIALQINSATFDEIENYIRALILKMGVKKSNFIGYSMGGRIVLDFLIKNGNFCDKIILESVSPGLRTDAEKKKRIAAEQKWLTKLNKMEIGDFLLEWYDQSVFCGINQHPGFKNLLKQRMKNKKENISQGLEKLSVTKMPDYWPDLKNINAKILYITGEKDKKYKKVGKELSRLVKNGQLHIIKKAGHNTHFENEEEFIRTVQNFLV